MKFSGLFGDGDEGMSAVSALIHAVVAVAPVALVAVVAFPVTGVGVGFADFTEDADLNSLLGVVFAHEDVRWRAGLCERRHGSTVAVADQDMWMLVVWGIASFWCFSFVARPCCPAETEPVFTSLPETIAADADIVVASVATSTVVVQLVLDIALVATPACDVRFCVENRRN